MKKGVLIAGIALSAIALILCVFANVLVIGALIERKNAIDASGQIASAFSIFISVIFCVPAYIVQAVLNVAGIVTTAQTFRSESRAVHVTGIVFLAINAVMIVVSAAIFIAFFTICNSSPSETAFILTRLTA